jgi:hypothetical protein
MTTTTAPEKTGNGTVDPFAGLDPDVAAVAKASQSLVGEYQRHEAAIAQILRPLTSDQQAQVEAFHDRRFPRRRGRPPGAGTRT